MPILNYSFTHSLEHKTDLLTRHFSWTVMASGSESKKSMNRGVELHSLRGRSGVCESQDTLVVNRTFLNGQAYSGQAITSFPISLRRLPSSSQKVRCFSSHSTSSSLFPRPVSTPSLPPACSISKTPARATNCSHKRLTTAQASAPSS